MRRPRPAWRAGRPARACPRRVAPRAAWAGGDARADRTEGGTGRRAPEDAAARWLDDVVIGMPLCPFAAAAREGTRIVTLEHDTAEALLRAIAAEMRRLADASIDDAATTLCVLPPESPYDDFAAFMNDVVAPAQDIADALWDEVNGGCDPQDEDARADVQVVPFHPAATFEDSPSPAVDFSSRSPVPVVHLLRQADVDAARAVWPMVGGDAAAKRDFLDLPAENSRRLRRVGSERLASMLEACQRARAAQWHDCAIDVDDPRTEADGAALLAWAADRGADVSALEIVRVSPMGMGAAATRSIQRGAALFVLPDALVLTASRLAEQPDAPYAAAVASAAAATDGTDSSEQIPLAIALAAEHALMRAGTPGPLAPYMRMLPTPALLRRSHADVADRAALRAALAGSCLLVDLEARWAWLEAAYASAAEALATHDLATKVTADDLSYAFALVVSRAFLPQNDVAADDERAELALCPVADMLNHSPLAECSALSRNSENGSVCVRAHCAYDVGEELHDTFGELSASASFVRYGFVDTRDGVAEEVRLPLELFGDAETEDGRALLAALCLQSLTLNSDPANGVGDVAIGVASALVATAEEVTQSGWPASVSNDAAMAAAMAEDALDALMAMPSVRARALARIDAHLVPLVDAAGLAAAAAASASSSLGHPVFAGAAAAAAAERAALAGARACVQRVAR